MRYVIEHGTENNRWLAKIDRAGGRETGETTCVYRPRLEEALVFSKKAEAVAFARKWRARVWRIARGVPKARVYPEA